MDTDFALFVEQIKQATKIEDVIQAEGGEYRLRRRTGNTMRGEAHDSLVVRLDEQYYVWNSRSEKGDVFNWLEARHKWDFWTSLTWLAERAKIEMPRSFQKTRGEAGQTARVSFRLREDVFGLAMGVFSKLLWTELSALGYARGRGWTDETIKAAGLGYTGSDPAAAVKMIRDEFGLYQVDPESEWAVAVIGFRGDVKGWGRARGIEVQDNWIDWGFIPGMVGKKRLVYPHWSGGRVKYLSGRQILGDDLTSEGRVWKSYNLPVNLCGKRQAFFNHEYGRAVDEVTVVEGPADAITLGQWGMAAVALMGTAWEDHEELLKSLRERHKRVYVGLDADDAGMRALVGKDDDWPLGRMLGSTTRVVKWGTGMVDLGGGKQKRGKADVRESGSQKTEEVDMGNG